MRAFHGVLRRSKTCAAPVGPEVTLGRAWDSREQYRGSNHTSDRVLGVRPRYPGGGAVWQPAGHPAGPVGRVLSVEAPDSGVRRHILDMDSYDQGSENWGSQT